LDLFFAKLGILLQSLSCHITEIKKLNEGSGDDTIVENVDDYVFFYIAQSVVDGKLDYVERKVFFLL
jgi:hypothetical protein